MLLHLGRERQLYVSVATASCAVHEWNRALKKVLSSEQYTKDHGTFVTAEEMNSATSSKKSTNNDAVYVAKRTRRDSTKYSNSVRVVQLRDSQKCKKPRLASPVHVADRPRRNNTVYDQSVETARRQARLSRQQEDEKRCAQEVPVERHRAVQGLPRSLHECVLLMFAKHRKLSLVCYAVGIHSDNFSAKYKELFGCRAFSESLFYLTRPIDHGKSSNGLTGALNPRSREGALCFLSTPVCVRVRMARDIMITDFAYMYHFVPNHGRGFYGGRGGGVDEDVEVLAVADW